MIKYLLLFAADWWVGAVNLPVEALAALVSISYASVSGFIIIEARMSGGDPDGSGLTRKLARHIMTGGKSQANTNLQSPES